MTILEAPTAATAVDLPRPGGWRITWRGKSWTDADVTGQHLATLALLSGTDDFAQLDIDPRHGHQRLMSMLMALVAVDRADGLEDVDAVTDLLAVALSEVAGAPADEILAALTFE
jgi:hypothetical protein